MNEKKALGSRDFRGALLFAVCVCCCMLCAARAAEGRGCGLLWGSRYKYNSTAKFDSMVNYRQLSSKQV